MIVLADFDSSELSFSGRDDDYGPSPYAAEDHFGSGGGSGGSDRYHDSGGYDSGDGADYFD